MPNYSRINISSECLKWRPMHQHMRATRYVKNYICGQSKIHKDSIILWQNAISRLLMDQTSFEIARQMGCWYINYSREQHQPHYKNNSNHFLSIQKNHKERHLPSAFVTTSQNNMWTDLYRSVCSCSGSRAHSCSWWPRTAPASPSLQPVKSVVSQSGAKFINHLRKTLALNYNNTREHYNFFKMMVGCRSNSV